MKRILILILLNLVIIGSAMAGESKTQFTELPAQQTATSSSKVDTGDTTWMLISTALVMLMTPGLALFYGGMVRSKNVLFFGNPSLLGIQALSVLTQVVETIERAAKTGKIGDGKIFCHRWKRSSELEQGNAGRMPFDSGLNRQRLKEMRDRIAQDATTRACPKEFLRQWSEVVDGLVRKTFQKA